MKYTLKKSEELNYKLIVIAHNAKGYDCQFVRKWVIQNGIKFENILSGQKIMQLTIKHKKHEIIFKDSLNFIPMALSEFPNTFELEELHKGHFPYKFNTEENQDYIGETPSVKYYNPEVLKLKDHELTTKCDNSKCKYCSFFKWHKEQKNKTFNFKEEMYKYCLSDVLILAQGFEKFRKLFIQETRFDPLHKCTIAGVCFHIYKMSHMPSNTIAVFKSLESDTYSMQQLQWLSYIEDTENIKIVSASNKGEFTIYPKNSKARKVDGYCYSNNTVYEYYGCRWHGHDCHKSKYDATLYKNTMDKEKIIHELGYNLVTMWECEWTKHPKYEEYKLKAEEYDHAKLNPRNALFGGRTNAYKLNYECKDNEVLVYIDVNSLYPYVMYFKDYPIGHPELITPNVNDTDISKYYGFVKVKIIPPKNLYNPVLPMRSQGKLTFTLCRTCADTHSQECNHTDDERAIIGDYCTPEIEKAVEKGYKIDRIYKAYHYKEKSNDLFKSYIGKFYRLKVESECISEAEKQDIYNHMKIEVEANIPRNEGLRTIAKLVLNSLWGKFSEQLIRTHSKLFYNYNSMVNFIVKAEDRYEISDIRLISDICIEVIYVDTDRSATCDTQTNLSIGCFTTTHARLTLYEMLDKLNERVLYFDTDSIIYVADKSKPETFIPTSKLLGAWKDETAGDYIKSFVSTGPKSYSYVTESGKITTKIKGFKISAGLSGQLNHNAVKDVVKNMEKVIEVDNTTFTRKRNEIFTTKGTKNFKLVYDKRIINKCGNVVDTRPYGFTLKT